MDPSQDQQPKRSESENTMNWVMLVMQMYSTSVEVFLHRHLGERYLGFQAFGVLILVPCHAYFLQGEDLTLLMWFLMAYLVACVLQRIGMVKRKWQGVIQPSRYNGFPWLLGPKSRIDEIVFKHWVEPLLVALLGIGLAAVDTALCSYLIAAGIALYLKGQMISQLHGAQILDMQDAMFDQQRRAEQFRRMNGDLFDALRGRTHRSPWRH